MPADGLTKNLPKQRHEMFLRQLNLVDIKDQINSHQINATDKEKDSTKDDRKAMQTQSMD